MLNYAIQQTTAADGNPLGLSDRDLQVRTDKQPIPSKLTNPSKELNHPKQAAQAVKKEFAKNAGVKVCVGLTLRELIDVGGRLSNGRKSRNFMAQTFAQAHINCRKSLFRRPLTS